MRYKINRRLGILWFPKELANKERTGFRNEISDIGYIISLPVWCDSGLIGSSQAGQVPSATDLRKQQQDY